MEFKDREFIPVLLGADINTYSVARAFYEEYQVKTYVLGKYMSGPSCYSKITTYRANPRIDTEEVFLKAMGNLAKRHADKKLIVLGCGDNYVTLVAKCKELLPKNVIAPYIDIDLMNELVVKERFYELCDKYEIDYPATLIYKKEMGMNFDVEFQYPVILKPSDGVDYWDHPFPDQHKIYKLNSREEIEKTITDIYNAGYSDALIIQDMIPGNDEYMRVLTSYSGQDKKVKMMCLGHVLLEEHTPKGLGNHAMILTEPNEELMLKAKALLEELNYTGFSNFDIKYDYRDEKYKFFELNVRQGRSNFYVTASGFNIARYLVDDYIYNKDMPFEIAKEAHLWTVLPLSIGYKYVKDEELKAKIKQLKKENKVTNPLFMKGDLGLKRVSRLIKNHLKQHQNYKEYYK